MNLKRGSKRLLAAAFVVMLILAGCQAPGSLALSVTAATPEASGGAVQDGDTTISEDGLVTLTSEASVDETATRLEAALREQGLTVFGVIDHAANADQAGLELRPTRLILAGNPRLGTPLMQESPTVAIDLPQKFLIWEDAQGDVFITYNDPTYLANRHGLTGQAEVLDTIANALNNFAQTAAGAESVADPQAGNRVGSDARGDVDAPGQTDTEAENLEDTAGFPNDHLLVETDWLAERLEDPNLRIVDMRSSQSYAAAHVPNAVSVPVDDIASTVNNIPLEFDQDKVQDTLNRIGLTPDMTLVVYDDLGMMDAARLFWTLEYVGHPDVRVLHGGWNAWMAEDLPTSTETPTVEATSYPLNIQPDILVTAEELLDLLDEPNVTVVDARSPQEYTGEVQLAARGGHIPGAVNLVWLDTLTGGDTVYTIEADWRAQLQDEDVEVFKSAAEIQTLLEEQGIAPDQEVITYCQTLWRGAHVYFLLRLMGYEDVRGYDGSWAEWGNRTDLPVVTGSEPGSLSETTGGS